MRKCCECGKDIGITSSYDHPIDGENKTVCKSCYDKLKLIEEKKPVVRAKKETPTVENKRIIKLRQMGSVVIVIGTILLLFGLTTENWIRTEGFNAFLSGGNYDFWTFLSNFREASIPISIILIVLGIILLAAPAFMSIEIDKCKKEGSKKEEDALEILNIRYAKGEISKEEFEEMKKDIMV